MSDSINATPRSGRLHIGIFGHRNAGKSSLINAVTGHSTAIVSDVAGTTTDPVYKSMEIHGLGPCVLIDTAGFDDLGEVGDLRVAKTKDALDKTDIALLLVTPDGTELEKSWFEELEKRKIPRLVIVGKTDLLDAGMKSRLAEDWETISGERPVAVSSMDRTGIDALVQAMLRLVPADWGRTSLTPGLCGPGDVVMLVMPQDIQAPQGRLILPQVRVTRDLLDKKCIIVSCTTDRMEDSLRELRRPPRLIITDSQAFASVYPLKPAESLLTSFSILMAAEKSDIRLCVESAKALAKLGPGSRVLIAEACTHAPLSEDIGRVKIPAALRKRFGQDLTIDMVSGSDFPEDLAPYDIIIHCGGCMFNRSYMMSRVRRAVDQGVPMTNYGVALAWLTGILDKVELPGEE